MRVSIALLACALAAAAFLGWTPAGHAQSEASTAPQGLTIGGNYAFHIKCPDTLNGERWSIQMRVDHFQDICAKYLGRPGTRFTGKMVDRERVHLYLNGEFILAVTPKDAQINKCKKPAELAPIWKKKLQAAFDDAVVNKQGP